jgi:aminoglycoside N3'-acetyltransferase
MTASRSGSSTADADGSRRADRPVLGVERVASQLRRLGVRRGGVLLVHSSFRAIRPVEGGPIGLVAALRAALGPDGTLVMPSTTGDDDAPFDRDATPAAVPLGILPEIFRLQPGVLRSSHFAAFAAIGPEACRIVSAPLTHPPSAPGSGIDLIRRLDGQVLLLGVGHECDTMLHLAEIVGGAPYRVPRHYTVRRGGRPVRITYGENDHCCRRFRLADGWLRAAHVQSEGPVGHAHARLARARDIVDAAVERLGWDPFLFLHRRGAGCPDCDEAWDHEAEWAGLAGITTS